MRIILYTKSAKDLINKIFNAIENETLRTWKIKKDDKGSKYLTHTPEQWVDKALFGFNTETDKLIIFLTWWKDKVPTEDIKGYYMGRLTEVLLVHFSDMYNKFEIEKE